MATSYIHHESRLPPAPVQSYGLTPNHWHQYQLPTPAARQILRPIGFECTRITRNIPHQVRHSIQRSPHHGWRPVLGIFRPLPDSALSPITHVQSHRQTTRGARPSDMHGLGLINGQTKTSSSRAAIQVLNTCPDSSSRSPTEIIQ